MSARHPLQEVEVRIIAGQYEGRVGKVTRVLLDHGSNGFCEIEFCQTGKKPHRPERDLVPLNYLARKGGASS